MKTRMLRDIEVSEVGMGCMAFSHGYGQIPQEERIIENLDSANVELTDAEFTELEEVLSSLKVYGHRGLGGF